jgi:DNA-binding transcriptional MerR regulator
MKIGQLAQKTGVSRDTIRLYESMGLLKGISRPYEFNNYKDYADSNVDRIQFVLLMKKLGLSLKECKEIINKIADNQYNKTYQQKFVKSKISEIDEKIEELNQLKYILMKYNDECENPDIIDRLKEG